MPTTKVDYKRELRELYLPRGGPCLVDVPEMAFLMIDGHGDPNTVRSYRDAIEALYGVAYAVKFAMKRGFSAVDYSVMPLESLWWSDGAWSFNAADKSRWSWTAMIMQPEPVTEEIVLNGIQQIRAKKSLPALNLIRYEHLAEGAAAQVMYTGPYKDEGPAIQSLHVFIGSQGFKPVGKHHEIYLGDPRRSAPDKLRTVIRQPVAPL